MIAFVTSTAYTGSMIPRAASLERIRRCQGQRAAAAHLPNPGAYAAWLSTPADSDNTRTIAHLVARGIGLRSRDPAAAPAPTHTLTEFASNYAVLMSSVTHNPVFGHQRDGSHRLGPHRKSCLDGRRLGRNRFPNCLNWTSSNGSLMGTRGTVGTSATSACKVRPITGRTMAPSHAPSVPSRLYCFKK